MTKFAGIIWTALFALLLIAGIAFGIYALSAIGILIAWNLGVVGAAPALGLVVGKIGFWTAFGVSALVFSLRYIFGGKGLALEYAETNYYKALAAYTAAQNKRD